ncbi:hypothetical protein C0J45_18483 [Silurus meridionalis]|uniref:C2 domain-containing protein n=1 Tax=Silurus asotus TaxID=30991 RepID=A0AAD5FK14_SILAS|nr:hypothetical protein C0J45_18483 [Silurus meridionalis]KAI5618539.1 hypothetical protein C0J50_21931 [Silurus asotus]
MMSPLHLVSLLILVSSPHVMTSVPLRLWGLRAIGLPGDAAGNRPDPYVKVSCGGQSVSKTEVIKGTHNPTWDTSFFIHCIKGASLKMEIWDKDLKTDDLLGICYVRITSANGTGKELKCTSLKKGTFYYRYNLA